MPKITVTATVQKSAKGNFADVVVLTVLGVSFTTYCKDPESARALAMKIAKELNLCT